MFRSRHYDLPDCRPLPGILDDFVSTGYFSSGGAAGWIVPVVDTLAEFQFSIVKIAFVRRIYQHRRYIVVLDDEDIIFVHSPSGHWYIDEETGLLGDPAIASTLVG